MALLDESAPSVAVAEPERIPDRDLCAVFTTSFHPTKGNIVDWAMKSSDELSLDGVEFSTLPSGLHVVDEDIIYFKRGGKEGVCVFRRRKTEQEGMRGYKLGAVGVLLDDRRTPRPWLHVSGLRKLADAQEEAYGEGLLKGYFEAYRAEPEQAEDDSLDLEDVLRSSGPSGPRLHLPHLLRLLGPTSLLLYRYALARRRILIYTHPAVEPACMLAWCIQSMADLSGFEDLAFIKGQRGGKVPVLGLVSLMDIDRLKSESEKGKGWIACTTDAIFLERPQMYDLIVDLSTLPRNSAPSPITASPLPRPSFYLSTRVPHPTKPTSTHTLRSAHFAFSDLALWAQLERFLPISIASSLAPGKERWSDPWKVYEDVCTMCAGVLTGGWHASTSASGEGALKLEGEDDTGRRNGRQKNRVASFGQRSTVSTSEQSTTGQVQAQGMSIPPQRKAIDALRNATGEADQQMDVLDSGAGESGVQTEEDGTLESEQQAEPDAYALTALLLSHFWENSSVLLSALALLVDPPSPSIVSPPPSTPSTPQKDPKRRRPSGTLARLSTSGVGAVTRTLTPRDLLSLRLAPLSASDAKFVEWVSLERLGVRVGVRRGWWDLSLGLLGW